METENNQHMTSRVTGEWGSPEWVASYTRTYGMPPMAGAEGEGAPAAAEGGTENEGDPTGGLYNLDSVPADLRPHAEQIAKEISGNVTRRFQEAADYRSQWEPFEQMGLNEYEPEAIQSLLAFAELADDPDSFQEWWESVGDDMGFFDSEDDDGEDMSFLDGEDEGEQARIEQVKNMLEGLVDEKLQPIAETLTAAQEQDLIDEAAELIDERLEALKEEHGDFDEEIVMQLAYAHAPDPEALDKGFADYQRLVNGAAENAINGKANVPGPGEASGPADTSRKLPTSFDEAAAMAKERFAASS